MTGGRAGRRRVEEYEVKGFSPEHLKDIPEHADFRVQSEAAFMSVVDGLYKKDRQYLGNYSRRCVAKARVESSFVVGRGQHRTPDPVPYEPEPPRPTEAKYEKKPDGPGMWPPPHAEPNTRKLFGDPVQTVSVAGKTEQR